VLIAAGVGFVFLGGYWHEASGRGFTYATFSGLPAALGFALVIVAASAGRGPAVGWLSARPLVAIGVISYGIYLWHLPLLLVTRNAGLMPDAFVLRLLVMLALALAAGFASWRLVEQPLIRRFSSTRARESGRTHGPEDARRPLEPAYAPPGP
jgi:peptidoglycan/LPS O-acetylase OafA/YrhL